MVFLKKCLLLIKLERTKALLNRFLDFYFFAIHVKVHYLLQPFMSH